MAVPGPPPASAPPDQREVWVPANRLKDLLAKFPNAVVLSREQYQTLLRDAALDRKATPVAPRRAALTAAKYQARLEGRVVQITATLTVNVLTDEWAQVPLDFDGVALGAVQVDGDAALARPVAVPVQGKSSSAAAGPSSLLLRGRGERVVTVEFAAPIVPETGRSRLSIKLPSAAASTFVFRLPPNQRVESPQPISVQKTPEATSVSAGLSAASPVLDLTWRGAGDGAKALEPLVLANGIYSIDAEKVRADFGFAIETQLGNLPLALQIAIPANTKVLQVTGAELAKWEVADGRLSIALQPGERAATNLWVTLEMPSLVAGTSAPVALPVPRFEGLARMQGVFSIVGDAGVTVKEVIPGDATRLTDRANDRTPIVASYKFLSPPGPASAVVERVRPSFSADLDTRVEFKPDAIFIERTLTLHEEKGEAFQTALTLPKDEEVLDVRGTDDSEPDWRIEGGKLRLRWSDHAAKGAARVFKIRTRMEPEKWTQLGADGLTFTLGDALIDGAEKVTGYIALKADDSFRLEAAPSETLERRDGRTTPVQGDYAWFRRQDFALSVKVAKRPGEVLASLTGFALPLEGVLDLHAQMNFDFLHSGTRSVRIRVPKQVAANFYFDGPQIAERNLADDIWTIVFQKELTGSYALKITAQVAIDKATRAGESRAGESQFAIQVPVITPLDVVRASGVWAVEANTETEITFDAKGMNELDSLLAPRLPDYQPRHRVIGVFAWLGGDYALGLSGVRHAAASVLTSVVDQLELVTVVSTSGAERNQATFQVRTAGAQHLAVQLPEKSRLLSLTVDDALVKPVGERADQVRVQLPAKRDATSAVAVSIFYETPKGEWRSTGAYAAHAPMLAKEIPVLRSQWRLFLPDGFEYTGLESNLRVPERLGEPPLILAPIRMWDEWKIAGAFSVLASSGMSDPRDPRSNLSERQRRLFDERVAEQTPPPTPADQAALTSLGEPKPTDLITRKLERTIIPRLEFREATVPAAVDFLREKSADLDTTEPNPANRGVNFVLRVDESQLKDARITVSLTNIPLSEALRYVTSLAGLKYRVEPFAVSILPASANVRTDQVVEVPKTTPAKVPPVQFVDGTRMEISRTDLVSRKLERIIIPRIDFREATIREAVEFLKKKSVDLDTTEPNPANRGVNIVLKLDESQSNDARITVSLTNIPLGEALRYVTNIVGMKFRTEPYAVSIVPASVNTDSVITKEFIIRPDLIGRGPAPDVANADPDATRGGSGIAKREAAKDWLIANGLTFGPNASAIYIPSSNKLIVRNTQEQLDLMESLVAAAESAAAPREGDVSGLLPMRLELPTVGRVVVLEGLAAAETVEFRYDDWWSRARRLWLWFVAGGLACVLFARERPWWRTCWMLLVLTFFPLCFAVSAMPVCNALLGGWLISLVLQRLAARLIFAPRRKEVLA